MIILIHAHKYKNTYTRRNVYESHTVHTFHTQEYADSLQSEYCLIVRLYIILMSSNISSVNRMVMEVVARR